MYFGPSTSLNPPGVFLPISMLLARDRRETAEYVESRWRGIGCRYFGAFVLSTAVKHRGYDPNKFVKLAVGSLPENVDLLLKLGALKIPMGDVLPMQFVKGDDFCRDLHQVIAKQMSDLTRNNTVHYYAYTKIYQRYSSRRGEYDAYTISHIQQHIANGYQGSPVNSYSTLAISEQGNELRTVYEKLLQGPPRHEESSRYLSESESALGLEWRLSTRR